MTAKSSLSVFVRCTVEGYSPALHVPAFRRVQGTVLRRLGIYGPVTYWVQALANTFLYEEFC
jgi:hypothetical protein